MTHYLTRNNKTIAVDIRCSHPSIENGTCPTGKGDCQSCRFCKAEMSVGDAMYLINEVWAKVEEE